MLERSSAIKCPSIQYFLVNMKKVQQMLTVPGVVEQYLSDPAAVQRVKQTFKNIYSLEEVWFDMVRISFQLFMSFHMSKSKSNSRKCMFFLSFHKLIKWWSWNDELKAPQIYQKSLIDFPSGLLNSWNAMRFHKTFG